MEGILKYVHIQNDVYDSSDLYSGTRESEIRLGALMPRGVSVDAATRPCMALAVQD